MTFLIGASLFAGDASEVWSRLYDRVNTLDQKYSIMQRIVQLDDPSLELMLTQALDDLVNGSYYSYSLGDSYDMWEDLTKLIVRELGELKAQDSAYLLAQIMNDYQGLLKAEAMMGLGSMGAIEYTSDIATVLRNLNFNLEDDRDRAEKEAYGAIIALKRMGDLAGFEPVFYAHIGWYSRRVKDAAAETLAVMVQDPSDEILKIMESAVMAELMIALEVEAASQASNQNKAGVAAYALELGVSLQGGNLEERSLLRDLRNRAMILMVEYQAQIDEAIPSLERSYREAETQEEKLNAILALGVNGSNAAVAVLVEALDYFNERKLGGISPSNQENSVILQIIYALGVSGNSELAMPALSSLEVYDYSNSINRAARAAMENF